MDSQDKIGASVRQLLGEIQTLRTEEDNTPDNPVKANYLQCEIFRKFAVIKSLMASSPEAKEAIKEEVLLTKKQVGAEDADLKRTPVPKLLRANAVLEWTNTEEEAFPYLHLPPEVRRVILGYLTSPSDKLNLVKAVPSDGHMMGWQMDALQLELVLPTLLKRERKQGIYEILVNLCHASEKFHGVVKNLMERCVEYEDPNALHANFDFLDYTSNSVLDVAPKDWVLNPFPMTIHLVLGSDENSKLRLDQLRVLRQSGKHIRSVDLFLNYMPVLQAIQLLRDYLELMPNLRRLKTFIRLVPSPQTLDRNQIAETFRSVQLPELPHLKYLHVRGYNMKPVAAKLLRKYEYQSTLVFLKTDKFSMTSPRGQKLYPRLRVLEVQDVEKTDAKMIVSRLKPFVGSALKSISINIGYEKNSAENFRSLMCALSPFRDTVENLFVKFGSQEPAWCCIGLDWMAKVNFPKVKTLGIRNYPGSWDMLLQFPALEQLTLHLDEPMYEFYEAVSLSGVVELSCDKEKMYTSNIWKMLPFLDKIWIRKDWIGFTVLEVTRSDCLAYQRRFEGVVSIDGRVQGKIEQKGGVKIFVRQA